MKKVYPIEIDCPNCAILCESEAAKVEGVSCVTVNFMMQKMIVEFEDGADEKKVMKSVVKSCKKAEPDFSIEL